MTTITPPAKFVLFDLDNCLCDDGHRTLLLDFSKTGNARYDKYHAAHTEDKASPEAVNILMSEILANRTPIFITGRPDIHRSTTIDWLHLNFFLPCELKPEFLLWMRPADNAMPSYQLKDWFIQTSPYPVGEFAAAYDDFDSVLQTYCKLGIPCKKLAIHPDANNDRGCSSRETIAVPELEQPTGAFIKEPWEAVYQAHSGEHKDLAEEMFLNQKGR